MTILGLLSDKEYKALRGGQNHKITLSTRRQIDAKRDLHYPAIMFYA